MSFDTITRMERALMSKLQPLTGTRSTGTAIVRATGADVVLPGNSYAVPIPTSAAGNAALDYKRLVKTLADITVTATGTEVPVVSMLGGPRQVFDGNTALRWDPPVAGVELVSVLDSAGLSGGAVPSDLYGTVQQVTVLEGLEKGNTGLKLFVAGLGEGMFPAVVIGWEGASPGQARGIRRTLRRHQFKIFVVSSRADGDDPRRDEGKRVLAAVEHELADQSTVDGLVFSTPQIDVGNSGRLVSSPEVYIYWTDFYVSWTVETNERRAYAAWMRSRQRLTTMPDSDHPAGEELVLVDQSEVMPQDG